MAFIDDLTARTTSRTGMSVDIATAPAYEPVTVDELKDQEEITHDYHDAVLLPRVISAARGRIEAKLGICMMQQSWLQIYDTVPQEIMLARYPVLSVSKFEYVSDFDSDTWVTYASSNYAVKTGKFGKITPRSGTWPVDRGWAGARVTFACGYATLAANPDANAIAAARAAVPSDLRLAVLMLAATFYESREGSASVLYAETAKTYGSMPPLVEEIISPYVRWGV